MATGSPFFFLILHSPSVFWVWRVQLSLTYCMFGWTVGVHWAVCMRTKEQRLRLFYWHAGVLTHCTTVEPRQHFNTCSPWLEQQKLKIYVRCLCMWGLVDMLSWLDQVETLPTSSRLSTLAFLFSSRCSWTSEHNLILDTTRFCPNILTHAVKTSRHFLLIRF